MTFIKSFNLHASFFKSTLRLELPKLSHLCLISHSNGAQLLVLFRTPLSWNHGRILGVGCFMFRLFSKQLCKYVCGGWGLYGYGGFPAFSLPFLWRKMKTIFKLRSQLCKSGYSLTMYTGDALERTIIEFSKKNSKFLYCFQYKHLKVSEPQSSWALTSFWCHFLPISSIPRILKLEVGSAD